MDELASALRPHQVHLREDHAVLKDTLVRAALGEAHSDVVGIKHVLTACQYWMRISQSRRFSS